MKNILVALEMKYTDKPLLDYSKKLAIKFNAKVWLIHVAAPEPDFVGYDIGPQYVREHRAETLKKEHKELSDLMKVFDDDNINCEGLLIAGPTYETLLKEVKKLDIDFMILGNQKHGFMYDLFIGSTAKSVAKEINIPLLLIPTEA